MIIIYVYTYRYIYHTIQSDRPPEITEDQMAEAVLAAKKNAEQTPRDDDERPVM